MILKKYFETIETPFFKFNFLIILAICAYGHMNTCVCVCVCVCVYVYVRPPGAGDAGSKLHDIDPGNQTKSTLHCCIVSPPGAQF